MSIVSPPRELDKAEAERESQEAANDSPRVYVACLAAYNAGTLHGEWMDAAQEEEDLLEAIQDMLARSPEPSAEEWAIHDYECFGGLRLGEYEDLGRVAELARLIDEHGAAFAAYAGNVGTEHATGDGFEECFRGEWDSEEAYAEDLFDELYLNEVPQTLRSYVDYQAFARDLFMGDYWSADNPAGGVFVFDGNC